MKTVYTVESSVIVKNENGTSKRPLCSCGGWLKHWENLSGKKSTKCMIKDCNNDAFDGAHITRPKAEKDEYKTYSYIVPMCKEHNGKHGEELATKKNVTFVWANVSETCGKKK